MSVVPVLSARLTAAAALAFDLPGADPELRAATKPEFGHFQTNLALRLAKTLGTSPRAVAAELVAHAELDDLCAPAQIAGPGFVNLTLLPSTLAAGVNELPRSLPTTGRRVVVDYSQPNVAKQMHVGHLRSTVIGDALCNVLRYAGYEVVRQNHVGDWGTQFGMMVEQLLDEQTPVESLDLEEMQQLYQRSRKHFDSDPVFADRSRRRVVLLQSGDPRTRGIWQQLVDISLAEFDRVYALLGSPLTQADVVGESAYNDALQGIVSDLAAAGLLTESGGAQCAFLPGFTGRDGSPLPVIVQKSDGGFGYSATDLAAVRHRVRDLKADRIVYVVDHRQSLHFQQIFALARTARWLPETTSAEHVAFGTVLGPDGKPFKTRDGGTVSLVSLLDAAIARAGALLADRTGIDRESVARAVGIGAVKYADLSSDRTNDYVFDLDRMVAMTGNTGPYLQYAHARLTRLLSKAGHPEGQVTVLAEPAEQRLALLLAGFGDAVQQVAETLQPHRLCTYLYDVASALSAFYESCPVLPSEGETRTSRLALCTATRTVLHDGLALLGITAPDAM
ncbi:arginyl-tRNA synthetase [Kribbella flavida DSM 17836]|uniref:Arginine--tRNA ligase n=1 Tax=Kribbella flavida (strain DSM 17836 / JCM 10339 / NBRC 14399) TaxID=479435 RepID=D2PW09_KRIFD|nr:arginine--tRNA ligase [Kribbella flavida]ADB29666.1 arginyl-tRNA synthetase [Kribbella flavida DSM 17836]